MPFLSSIKKPTWLPILLLPILASALPAQAQVKKWGPHADFEAKLGTERSLGEADLFTPLLQDDDTLFFSSIRTRFDTNGSFEGNFGFGVRQMLDSGWNIGAEPSGTIPSTS